ncbi:MAG: hypothetical protein A3H39_13535 [candidate division NC10 bacterium RIFCSPLOWO2_02_FULL_66_22]|nr:MAG: hypothetical protein A3H39_13535 [candidate division NC10 bacterium RIFCSPLOWO2_02_FULL_66_22]
MGKRREPDYVSTSPAFNAGCRDRQMLRRKLRIAVNHDVGLQFARVLHLEEAWVELARPFTLKQAKGEAYVISKIDDKMQ